MRRRPSLLPVLVLVLAIGISLSGASSAAGPQVVDPANDANLVNGQGNEGLYEPDVPLPRNNPTPVGSQAYADVLSVTWTRTTSKVGKKHVFSGFKVEMKLSAPPVAPAPTVVVYRMLGRVNGNPDLTLGTVYYTSAVPKAPRSALRDTLGVDNVVRLTPIALPVIKGSTVTWTVPKSVFPKELPAGATLKDLYFEVREIESFQGAEVPATVPGTSEPVPVLGGATGLAVGFVDRGDSKGTFKLA